MKLLGPPYTQAEFYCLLIAGWLSLFAFINALPAPEMGPDGPSYVYAR
jgi:hypothetical protein